MIKFYRRAISPLLGNTCRFYPSCSQYALDCFENYPFWKASGKTVWRILRCQPFSKGHFDPAVPEHSHSHT